jgi:H+/Cl- antiporter ClcA
VALAAGIGVAAGSATALFLHLLAGAAAQAQGISFHLFFLPLGLFVSAVIVRYVARDAMGYGTEKVIEAVHKSDGRIRFQVIPAKLLATIVTIASGGSAGQVGPCAQIGGGLASAFARILNMDGNDWKKLVICGIGAGFAAVLGAPVAGAVFGVEVLFVGAILYEVLLPSFIAGIVSYHTASLLGVRYFHYQAHHLPPFSEVFFLEIVVSGIFFGICAILAIEAMTWSRRLFDRIPVWSPFRGLIGGGILICLAFLVSPRYLGLGSDLIADALQGGPLAWHAFLSKTLFTALTFASGGSGGIIAPLLVIGATAGSTFGDWSGLGGTTFAAIGLVSVLAGAANAPIAMSVLAIELFGRELGPMPPSPAWSASSLPDTAASSYPDHGHEEVLFRRGRYGEGAGPCGAPVPTPGQEPDRNRTARIGKNRQKEASGRPRVGISIQGPSSLWACFFKKILRKPLDSLPHRMGWLPP